MIKELTGKKKGIIAGVAVAVLLLGGCAAYWGMAQKYQNVFFPNTIVNGLNVSNYSVEQIQAQIASNMNGYTLTLEERGDTTEVIRGMDIDLHPEYDGTLEKLLAAQNPLEWGKGLLGEMNYTIETMLVYDEEKLRQVISQLNCFDTTAADEPKNAYMSDYIENVGYEIVPQEPGKIPVEELVVKATQDALMNMKTSLSLDEAGVYKQAEITSESEELKAKVDKWNQYINTTVTYKFGEATDPLTGNIIHTWLSEDENGEIIVDEVLVGEYVAELAKKHNTAYAPKQLKTSYGPTVTITRGNYGWRINQVAEVATLMEIIQSREPQEREPVYSQTAASHGENDYGNTYVELNLTTQHLYFYKDGSLLIESDFVSGNESSGWGTPGGAYPLTYKQRNATLKGEGYATPVSYWMPFNGGIGMHDATWRGSFGGKIYKTNGSHGCINLPKSVAKTIFENIEAGIPVLCYHLDANGTTPTQTTQPASTKPAATQPAPTPPPIPEPAPISEETTAAPVPEETAPEPTKSGSNVVGPGINGGENQGPGVTTQSPEPSMEESSQLPSAEAPAPEEPGTLAPEGPGEVGPGAASNSSNNGPGGEEVGPGV